MQITGETRDQIRAAPGYENDLLLKIDDTFRRAEADVARKEAENAKKKRGWRR